PLSLEHLLVYGVGHLKISESDDKQTERERQSFPTDAKLTYSSKSVVHHAGNHNTAERARIQSICGRSRNIITVRRSIKVATGCTSNERATRSQRSS
ncbi:MAG: hypothetical protein EZS28_048762, partial [Streblomastix strix]